MTQTPLIQWYPGHMYKAGKEIRKIMPKVDIVIEIVDARIPFSSQNPFLKQLRDGKPSIKILNKTDLADPEITQQWQIWFEKEKGVKTLAVSNTLPAKIKTLSSLCHKLLPDKIDGVKEIHALVMGIPNVGKSTIINILADKIIAKTGNEPAVTKRQQRIKLDGLVLLDTPGMLWPNIENKNSGYRLACTGAVKDTAMDSTDVAFFAAEYLLQKYPERLQNRYQLEELPEGEYELLSAIGKKRGCLRAGGDVELDKVSRLFLTEIRAGVLGQISLETPVMVEKELVELEIILAEKAEKKAARKEASGKKKNKYQR